MKPNPQSSVNCPRCGAVMYKGPGRTGFFYCSRCRYEERPK